MEVDLEFPDPFYGIVYSNFDRRSACSFVGKGGTKYHYEFPLSGCGTIQVYYQSCRIILRNIKSFLGEEGGEVVGRSGWNPKFEFRLRPMSNKCRQRHLLPTKAIMGG